MLVSVEEARAILGDDVLGPSEVERAFGGAAAERQATIPFTRDELIAACNMGEMLVLRVTRAGGNASWTILEMIRRFPQAFDQKLLRQVGYQLKDEWGIELEPLADTDTCVPGWALVRKDVLDDSRNLPYDDQDAALRAYAKTLGKPLEAVRRRSAVEAVYDTVLYFAARTVRLLEQSWDWTASRTVDGGYLNVGGFTSRGIQILSYSKAIRHGGLGVCPTRQRNG